MNKLLEDLKIARTSLSKMFGKNEVTTVRMTPEKCLEVIDNTIQCISPKKIPADVTNKDTWKLINRLLEERLITNEQYLALDDAIIKANRYDLLKEDRCEVCGQYECTCFCDCGLPHEQCVCDFTEEDYSTYYRDYTVIALRTHGGVFTEGDPYHVESYDSRAKRYNIIGDDGYSYSVPEEKYQKNFKEVVDK